VDHNTFDKILNNTIEEMRKLSTLKGGEYAGDVDRLANFKRNAASFGVTPLLIWGVYAGKHWDAIAQYINDFQNNKYRQRGEAIEGRLDDLIVYCVLMKALIAEGNNHKHFHTVYEKCSGCGASNFEICKLSDVKECKRVL
jgi:hypothetical protein